MVVASLFGDVETQNADVVGVVAGDPPDEKPGSVALAIKAGLVVGGFGAEGVLEEAGVAVRQYGKEALDATAESSLRVHEVRQRAP